MQTVEACDPNEYPPAITMQFCQSIFDSYALDLQISDDGGLDYTTIIGEPPASLHRVAYVFLRDSLNKYLASGNELPISEIPEVPMTRFLHLQLHPRLICVITKPAVSMAARMDLNISIGTTAIWMVPINTRRPTTISHSHPVGLPLLPLYRYYYELPSFGFLSYPLPPSFSLSLSQTSLPLFGTSSTFRHPFSVTSATFWHPFSVTSLTFQQISHPPASLQQVLMLASPFCTFLTLRHTFHSVVSLLVTDRS